MAALFVTVLIVGFFIAKKTSAHDHYRQWFGVDGGPCCSDLGRECRPVRSYFDDETQRFKILLGGLWTVVPASAVRPYHSPDGSSHACLGTDGTIYCFVNGEPKS